MDIKTHIRKHNVQVANKILRKGRGAWGDFVNSALEALPEAGIKVNDLQLDKPLTKNDTANAPDGLEKEYTRKDSK